jgi:hypothetical protein
MRMRSKRPYAGAYGISLTIVVIIKPILINFEDGIMTLTKEREKPSWRTSLRHKEEVRVWKTYLN